MDETPNTRTTTARRSAACGVTMGMEITDGEVRFVCLECGFSETLGLAGTQAAAVLLLRRLSLRFSFSDFCATFLPSFLGLSEPLAMDLS